MLSALAENGETKATQKGEGERGEKTEMDRRRPSFFFQNAPFFAPNAIASCFGFLSLAR